VRRLAEEKERHLAQNLATFERRVAEAEAKLSELTYYKQDYEKRFSSRAAQGIGATELRDYQAFLARLGEAIRQQTAIVERARMDRDLQLARWRDAAQRTKAVEHVIERWRVEERRAHERREQRETDERAQRRVQSS